MDINAIMLVGYGLHFKTLAAQTTMSNELLRILQIFLTINIQKFIEL